MAESTAHTQGFQKVSMVLNTKPAKRSQLIYAAIILSLSAHIFWLAIMYLATASPAGNETGEEQPMEEMELKFEEPEEMAAEMMANPNMSEPVRNLLANAESQRTNEVVNYAGKSQAEIDAEVNANLRALEQNEFNALQSNRKDGGYSEPQKTDPNAKDNKNTSKEKDYEWYKNGSNKSTSGPVSAEYFLSGRTAKSTKKPTYRCKSSGKVVVKITVAPTGEVVDASVDDAKSVGSDCIREESLNYAKLWTFNYDAAAAKKQNGTITFTFNAQ